MANTAEKTIVTTPLKNGNEPTKPQSISDAIATGKKLVHLGGKVWQIDGMAVANAAAMAWMKAREIAVPVWLDREVRTGLTLDERRAKKVESAARRAAETKGEWSR